jgi:hypothetical protein
MRKKSHVVQRWVDSINAAEENTNCDSNELNINEAAPSTSEAESRTTTSVKGKFSEICNKLNVNEKLKGKKIDLKNLISKTTHKIKRQSSRDVVDMEQQVQQHDGEEEASDIQTTDKAEQSDDLHDKTNSSNNDEEEEEERVASNGSSAGTLTVQRCHISVLGRSSSENPDPPARNRRLTDIGRSFSVAHDPDLPTADSSENLIYDADEDISITIPSFETSPSVLSNKTNSNNQLDNVTLRPSLSHMRPLREHTVSEGHSSPHVLPKNPLLRDSSFQVSRK